MIDNGELEAVLFLSLSFLELVMLERLRSITYEHKGEGSRSCVSSEAKSRLMFL